MLSLTHFEHILKIKKQGLIYHWDWWADIIQCADYELENTIADQDYI